MTPIVMIASASRLAICERLESGAEGPIRSRNRRIDPAIFFPMHGPRVRVMLCLMAS